MKKRYLPYLLVLPMFITVFILTIYPSIYSILISFQKFQEGVKNPTFTGLTNYINLLASSTFWNSLFVTVKYTLGAVFFEFILGFIIALLLNKIVHFRTLFRTLLILPLAVMPTISALTWRMIYNPTYGVLNGLLNYFGFSGSTWHTGANSALLSVIMVDVWQWTPFLMLILFAGLQMLPKEVYEAAAIDGANSWVGFWKITFPLIMPVASIGLSFRVLDAFRSFDIIFVLTKGGPGRATESLVIKTFIEAFYNYDLGEAAALSVFMLVVATIAARILLKRLKD
ncbi:MAG: Trehalose transport system permease protein SugA [Firmicutes bacterium ADurb.Bin419]|nr:MAG: Trehalose transport system permease protein SugA [Firmicutes bacterium ADurb.Bin419]